MVKRVALFLCAIFAGLALFPATARGAESVLETGAETEVEAETEAGAITEIRIEQAQFEMPMGHVYFYASGEAPQNATVTLNGTELTLDDPRPYDKTTDTTHYYFLVDCSTSTTGAMISAVKVALASFLEYKGPNDTVTILTFGVSVDALTGEATDDEEILEAIMAIEADQRGTVFFDAIAKAVEIADKPAHALDRKLAFVFSDSIDYNMGGFTREEIDTLLSGASIPFYAMGFDYGTKSELDVFGSIARTSGATISIVSAATLPETFIEVVKNTQSAWVADVERADNIIEAPMQELRVQASSKSAVRQVPVTYWQPDTTAPRIVSVAQQTDVNIAITFSEPVVGAAVAESYMVTRENGDLVGVKAAAYDETTYTALISIDSNEQSGGLAIECPGVTDRSMEANPVTGAAELQFTGAGGPEAEGQGGELAGDISSTLGPAEQQPQGGGMNAGAWFLLAVIAMAIIVGVALAVIKKRGGVVVQDGKIHYTDATEVEKQLADSPDVQVRFVSAALPKINMIVTSASGESKRVNLAINGTLFVGRGDMNDLVFDDAEMSRQHFVIEEKEGAYTLANLSETGGTLLNGVPVNKPRPLYEGDLIQAGREAFQFFTGEVQG